MIHTNDGFSLNLFCAPYHVVIYAKRSHKRFSRYFWNSSISFNAFTQEPMPNAALKNIKQELIPFVLRENLKLLFELVDLMHGKMCCYCIAKFDHHLELIVNLSLKIVSNDLIQ